MVLQGDDETVLRQCYEGVQRDGEVIRVRDTVLLRSGPLKKSLPYVAKISALWDDPRTGDKSSVITSLIMCWEYKLDSWLVCKNWFWFQRTGPKKKNNHVMMICTDSYARYNICDICLQGTIVHLCKRGEQNKVNGDILHPKILHTINYRIKNDSAALSRACLCFSVFRHLLHTDWTKSRIAWWLELNWFYLKFNIYSIKVIIKMNLFQTIFYDHFLHYSE